MAAVRRLPLPLLLATLLSPCGGSSSASGPDPAAARSTTTAEGSARFTLLIDAVLAGSKVRSSETGTISFAKHSVSPST